MEASLRTVFLCGPITGVPLEQAVGWRRRVNEALAGEALTIDPTRHPRDPFPNAQAPETQPISVGRLSHGKRTVARDRFDLARSDLVLACFLGAQRVSIGAVGEIFWADLLRKPVIIVRELDNLHNHDMLNEIASWIFDNLDDAIDQVRQIVRPNAYR